MRAAHSASRGETQLFNVQGFEERVVYNASKARAKMAEQDARGALGKAREEGVADGLAQGPRRGLADLCEAFGIEMTEERQQVLTAADLPRLEALRERIKLERQWPGMTRSATKDASSP